MRNLSVIIPFYNENIEVENTLKSIQDTADEPLDIVLVNDGSDDSYDYKKIADMYSAIYIVHHRRLGSGPAKQAGIDACQTPYFLVIDAHMRFYRNGWCKSIIQSIENNSRAIYCCCCKVWHYETKKESPLGKIRYGASLQFFQPEKRNILEPVWIKEDIWGKELVVDVPCILGACYSASKEYWNYLKGYEGLKLYGCEEFYISLKAWMEGGCCRLIKDIEIGHLFKENAFFTMERNELFYNKMVIIETLFPNELQRKYIRALKAMNYVDYVHAKEQIEANAGEISSLRSYYENILTVPLDEVMRFTASIDGLISK